ncbi:50S ribosomal protein L20 [Candidatus Vidania fulgoroideorum]
MTRVKRGVCVKRKHKKLINKCKGFIGRRKNVFKVCKQAYIKSLQYFYRDVRNKKRDFRKKWIKTINFHLREINENFCYSKFIDFLKKKSINLNRKNIYDLSINYKLDLLLDEIKYIQN